jgi:hypothetical protein
LESFTFWKSHGRNPDVSPRVRRVVLDHLETDADAREEILEKKEQ